MPQNLPLFEDIRWSPVSLLSVGVGELASREVHLPEGITQEGAFSCDVSRAVWRSGCKTVPVACWTLCCTFAMILRNVKTGQDYGIHCCL